MWYFENYRHLSARIKWSTTWKRNIAISVLNEQTELYLFLSLWLYADVWTKIFFLKFFSQKLFLWISHYEYIHYWTYILFRKTLLCTGLLTQKINNKILLFGQDDPIHTCLSPIQFPTHKHINIFSNKLFFTWISSLIKSYTLIKIYTFSLKSVDVQV